MCSSLWAVCVTFLVVFSSVESRKFAEKMVVNRNSSSRSRSSRLPAFFVFGDSTVDSGNNNYVNTISRSNFPPYGRDFPNHIPTGRFTNGKLVTDFIASYAGLKGFIPTYLDPTRTLDDLKTGACFASASTGFDPLTAQQYNVISMQRQVAYFKEYKSRMEGYIGKEKTNDVINKGVFLISAGTNDFIVNYYGTDSTRRNNYTISAYQDFILQLGQQFLLDLVEMGARTIAFVGLPPMGCLPAVITTNSDNFLTHRGCIQRLSTTAIAYNRILRTKLTAAMHTHPAAQIFYVDIYQPLDDMIKSPQQYGFENVKCGCCGSGTVEISYFCNSLSVLCWNESKYVFWDAIHPSEAAYYNIFKSLRPIIDKILKS